VPIENLTDPGGYDSSFTDPIWAYDYERDAWLCQLPEYYMNAGAQELDGELYLLHYDPTSGTNWKGTLRHCSKRLDTVMFPNYASDSLKSKYVFGWYHLGAPSQIKKFNRIRLFCHESVSGMTTLTANLLAEHDFQEGTYLTDIEGITVTIGGGKKIKLTGQRARAIRITIEAEQLGDMAISGFELEWCQPYQVGMKE
jgi:hypothetical protein